MSRRLIFPSLIVLVGTLCVKAADQARPKEETPSTHVNHLIEKLGSETYAIRVRARDQLLGLGLEAFDELHAARYHPDIEIKMAARYLVSGLTVSWSKVTDPPEIREVLQEDYGTQPVIERASRIKRLSLLEPEKSFDALVRLTRFETSPRLSESAALTLMNQTMVSDEGVRARMSEKIISGLGSAGRPSMQWLRVYAKDLNAGGYSKAAWDDLIVSQRDQIETAAAHPATCQSVLELVRICASREVDSGDRDEALRLATQHLDLIEPTSRRLIDATNWAIDHDLHPVVLSLREQFKRMFDSTPTLLYAAGEATQEADDESAAQNLADEAFNTAPMPGKVKAWCSIGERVSGTQLPVPPPTSRALRETHTRR